MNRWYTVPNRHFPEFILFVDEQTKKGKAMVQKGHNCIHAHNFWELN